MMANHSTNIKNAEEKKSNHIDSGIHKRNNTPQKTFLPFKPPLAN